jgi:small subunit ribosomal protein S20
LNIVEYSSKGQVFMAQHLSAERQARKALKHRTRNRNYMAKMRTAVKRVRGAKEKAKAAAELRKVVKLLDQLAAKGIIHRNTAANKKSSLTKHVSKLA